MSHIWPKDTIALLIQTAEASGEAKAMLSSPEEAAKFRWAIYNYRKHNKVGQELLVVLEDCSVLITKRPAAPVIHIVNGN